MTHDCLLHNLVVEEEHNMRNASRKLGTQNPFVMYLAQTKETKEWNVVYELGKRTPFLASMGY